MSGAFCICPPAATPARDVISALSPDGSIVALWLATDEGIVWADADADNLQVPTAWTVEDGFVGEAYSLAMSIRLWEEMRIGSAYLLSLLTLRCSQ